jgi:hypothetical protein
MRNQNRVVISTGAVQGSYRFVETPEGNIITETLSSYDSLGAPIWTVANPTKSMIQEVGARLGWRIDTKARARRNRYENNTRTASY